jgi:phage-related minor tail protein
MTERLGVDLSVDGFSSFDQQMRRVQEIFEEFQAGAPKYTESFDSVAAAYKRFEKALKGSTEGGASAINATTNAISKAGTTGVSALSDLSDSYARTVEQVRGLESEVKRLNTQLVNQANNPLARPQGANLEALRGQIKAASVEGLRDIDTLVETANARLAALGDSPGGKQLFDSMIGQIDKVKVELETLSRKRTAIDPSMLDQVDQLRRARLLA